MNEGIEERYEKTKDCNGVANSMRSLHQNEMLRAFHPGDGIPENSMTVNVCLFCRTSRDSLLFLSSELSRANIPCFVAP